MTTTMPTATLTATTAALTRFMREGLCPSPRVPSRGFHPLDRTCRLGRTKKGSRGFTFGSVHRARTNASRRIRLYEQPSLGVVSSRILRSGWRRILLGSGSARFNNVRTFRHRRFGCFNPAEVKKSTGKLDREMPKDTPRALRVR